MKTMYLTSLMLLLGLAACSGGHTTGDEDGGKTRAQLKKEAADAKAAGDTPTSDVCGDNDWYGDGQCDTFCNATDSVDCAPDCGGGVVCAAFIEESDGACTRDAGDPCIGQDPDCAGSTPPSGGDEPIACPAIAEVGNGVCDRPANDPCRFIDPDCATSDDPGVPTDPGMGGGSQPGNPGGMPTDPVACAEFIEQPDNVCKRDPADPCIFQDPDCNVK